ncbi:soma ferritin-like [Gigantopelta aegis]|uniref:soma ferritin-like n=1 Tax=Gigantopelta aegis TaxID=1735272 RepID=UPI001B88BC32|nr:soma ferritin-like [Gigantopelta aegis]
MFDWKIVLLLGVLAFVAALNFGEDGLQGENRFVETDFSQNQDVTWVKYNFSQTTITQLNYLIHNHLVEDLFYLNMGYNFERADVALPGFYKFFRHMSEERRKDGEKIMTYLNRRGGAIKFRRTMKLPDSVWRTGLAAMEASLGHEKELHKKILKMHVTAAAAHDPHLTNFLEDEFLEPKVSLIKKLADYVTRLKSFQSDYSLGEYILDQNLE